MKISKQKLRILIAEEATNLGTLEVLDEAFFDDVIGKLKGVFQKKQEKPAQTSLKKSEYDIAIESAKLAFSKTKKTIQNFADSIGTISLLASAKKPPSKDAMTRLKNQLQSIQSLLTFGKQTLEGLEPGFRREIFQDMQAISSTLGSNPGLNSLTRAVNVAESLVKKIESLRNLVDLNEKKFLSKQGQEKFKSEFEMVRSSGKPFMFENKLFNNKS